MQLRVSPTETSVKLHCSFEKFNLSPGITVSFMMTFVAFPVPLLNTVIVNVIVSLITTICLSAILFITKFGFGLCLTSTTTNPEFCLSVPFAESSCPLAIA